MKYIAIVGPSNCSSTEKVDAYNIGSLLAASGSVVICGGGSIKRRT